MISVSKPDELEDNSEYEQKIFGKVAEVMSKNSAVPKKYLDSNVGLDMDAQIIFNDDVDMEEMGKIWSGFGEPTHLSLFYVIGPICFIGYDPLVRINRREQARAMLPDAKPETPETPEKPKRKEFFNGEYYFEQ